MSAWVVLTAGWAWAHPVFLAVYALGVLFALWMLSAVVLTPAGAPAAQDLPDLTVELPCVQPGGPADTELVEWASRWAEVQERRGNPITLHGLLEYPVTSPAAPPSQDANPAGGATHPQPGTAAAAGGSPPPAPPPPLPNWDASVAIPYEDHTERRYESDLSW